MWAHVCNPGGVSRSLIMGPCKLRFAPGSKGRRYWRGLASWHRHRELPFMFSSHRRGRILPFPNLFFRIEAFSTGKPYSWSKALGSLAAEGRYRGGCEGQRWGNLTLSTWPPPAALPLVCSGCHPGHIELLWEGNHGWAILISCTC